ncbi:hypothetical protein PI95_027325 [Hassallia byssoidea VB512170]|uniref:DUF4435 domain-containing protein n=1 Tax=Hassallia byssoidea VB512170 TaxID=1304833 RepID=A0A846HF06_9CYAN|nr:DUF3226 domain-containing protein [Hassalia byssoidea]NEU76137.1 hypothetical protein [Hassalia byssoidea VB512170]
MSKKSKPHQLLVEGKNDRHVIWALCNQYQLPETFSVEVPAADATEGIEALLDGLPLKLREKNLEILGIVVDADQDLGARWQALGYRLRMSGYQDIPDAPPTEGWVYTAPELPKVGVWLMPNNQLPGMLEDFVTHLIPANDKLLPKAESILQEIEQAGINPYTFIHRPKALIYTWLAWQEKPGMPMGQAITARVLRYDSTRAIAFVEWLKRLFNLL